MSGDVFLGIDLGTTMLKAGVVDGRTGRVLVTASARLPVRTAADGAREQDPRAIDRALTRLAGSLRRRLGRAWRRVAGLGLAAQGGSAILVDRRTGRAHTAMQLWSDTRPLKGLREIAARKPRGYWRRLSYLPEPGAGLARIEWLRAQHPRLFHEGNLYVGAGEYVYFRLTGLWRQDAGSALQIGCYDARRRRLAAGPLRAVGAELSLVAPMREGHKTYPLSRSGAAAMRLPEGLPVAGPYMDHEAGYLAAAGVSSRPLECSLGTAWVGSFVFGSGPPPPGGLSLVVPSPVGPGSLVMRAMLAGTVSWDWALASLVDVRAGGALRRADAIFREDLLPPEGLVGLPWLTRPNLLAPATAGAGGFLGIGAHTTRAELLRALVAGMCFEFARLFEPVVRRGSVDSALLVGGASKGRQFRTLLAGLFAPLPVSRPVEGEVPGVRGTLHAFSPTAACVRTRRVRAPSAALQRRIRRQYDLYCRAREGLARGLGDGGGLLLRDLGGKGQKP